MSQVDDPIRLLKSAVIYIRDLADSLANACEDFEGDEEDDPQATGEVAEARAFNDRIKKYLASIKE